MAILSHLLLAYDADCLGAGFGVWTGMDPITAIKAGYRHFDTASIMAIRRSGVPLEQFFICTKFPRNHHDRIGESLNENLENLGMDCVDLFLMYWPQYVVYEKDNFLPKNPDGTVCIMENSLETGKCKPIGVSNFSAKTLEKLLTTAKIIPAVNQIEQVGQACYIYISDLVQEELMQYCRAKGIVVVAYTPTGLDVVRKDPAIIESAEKCNATSTQVILAWYLARGVVAVPKSADEGRQKENRTRISGLDKNDRLCNKAMEVNGTLWGWTYDNWVRWA
ncbi:reductase AKOR2 [Armillaria fumosa]|nr:reductase AKOR2 [Armillaria fumosa]